MKLVLFFTKDVSLKVWDETGLLGREIAVYKRLQKKLGGVKFITYGDSGDLKYRRQLDGIRVICNRWRLPDWLYKRVIGSIYPMFWHGKVVVKSNQSYGADLALRAARVSGKKFIARCGYLHSDFVSRAHGKNSPEASTARATEKRVFRAADRVVVTTATMQAAIMDDYGVPNDRIRIIPNYVDTDLFRPGSNATAGTKRLCFIGRFERQKNPMLLIEAIKGLDVELLMVGKGTLASQIKTEARTHDLGVRIVGPCPNKELPGLMNSSSIFVLPSDYEGHPKVLLEAMACGLPVIGRDVPGVREIIAHGENGYLCGLSAPSLHEAIRVVLDDVAMQKRLGRNAREFAMSHFSLDKVVEKELALLGELAG